MQKKKKKIKKYSNYSIQRIYMKASMLITIITKEKKKYDE